MSGPGEPPEGTPEGAPGGGDDEYRSVVFDESFVRAARIQEFSARERLDDAARPVRIRHVLPRGLARQAMALVVLIATAFGFAIYMGVRHPYQAGDPAADQQLRITVIPLVPAGRVPAVSAASPFAGGTAEHYPVGAAGLTLPRGVQRVGGYAQSEVMNALKTAREYLKDSSINPRTVTGGDVGAVRSLIDPGQLEQFDSSLSNPAADGSHEATGWLVRFDPSAQVALVRGGIRVHGTLDVTETGDNALEISSDHTFVYALRGTGANATAVSLFTVRRQLRFRFDHEDLREHHIEIVQADVAAGPLSCTASVDAYFEPILAGRAATGTVTGADPYDHDHPVGAVCAPLGSRAQPTAGVSGSPAAAPPSARTTPVLNPPLLLPTPDPAL
ncbi:MULTISPECIES: SCO2583 family membrane protein [unclassified Streptomyces]|uniref:SCO2583 family membrane protein n=1 Tax=unclassified Streptomyces TaxID=2593676 RepID=UPI002E292C62|nr:hypothetical protein [Streptomyces sp. NBC_00223]